MLTWLGDCKQMHTIAPDQNPDFVDRITINLARETVMKYCAKYYVTKNFAPTPVQLLKRKATIRSVSRQSVFAVGREPVAVVAAIKAGNLVGAA